VWREGDTGGGQRAYSVDVEWGRAGVSAAAEAEAAAMAAATAVIALALSVAAGVALALGLGMEAARTLCLAAALALAGSAGLVKAAEVAVESLASVVCAAFAIELTGTALSSCSPSSSGSTPAVETKNTVSQRVDVRVAPLAVPFR